MILLDVESLDRNCGTSCTVYGMHYDGIVYEAAVTWNTLIDSHCKSRHHNKAEELFEAMQNSGCSPFTTTYNIMINSFGEQERWEDVKTLLGKMQSQGLLANVVTYTTLVDIYGQSGRFKDAIECLEVMKSVGLKPSSTMYNALINAYAQRVSCYLITYINSLHDHFNSQLLMSMPVT